MVDWLDFRNQRQLDIAGIPNCCMTLEIMEMRAYHLQQAVEKHTKFILLHGGLMPKRKTHLTVPQFLDEFVTGINDFKRIAQKHNNQFLDDKDSRKRRKQFLNQTRIIMERLAEGRASFLSALWKNSLGIPLVDRQEEVVFQLCPIFRRRSKLKINMVYGYGNETEKKNFLNDPTMKRLHYYKPIVELGPMMGARFPHPGG